MRPGEAHLREHYADLAARPFFPGLVRWTGTYLLGEVYIFLLKGVLHELWTSGCNGLGRPGCCQDWQVGASCKKVLLNNLAVRVMLGETNPAASKPGTIRGDYCIQVEDCIYSMPIAFYHDLKVGRNICHGSDAVESAEHEIKLWFRQVHCSSSLLAAFFTFFSFRDEDICNWTPAQEDWVLGNN